MNKNGVSIIQKKLNLISDSLFRKIDNQNDIGLYSGSSGYLLFLVCYQQFQKKSDFSHFSKVFNKIIEQLFYTDKFSFCNGLAGVLWLNTFLFKERFIDKEVLTLNKRFHQNLQEISLYLLEIGNYDFLHGSLGIPYYLLYNYDSDNNKYFKNYLNQLNFMVKEDSEIILSSFDFVSYQKKENETNLSLSHGIASILKFCLICIEKKTCEKISHLIIRKIINYYLRHVNDGANYYFNDVIGKPQQRASRLAWCYGDLGISFILLQASIKIKDKKLEEFATQILIDSCNRKKPNETFVSDAGICHGASGIAYLYHLTWRITNINLFKETSLYWFNQTLDFGKWPDTITGFKASSNDGRYNESSGLLEGDAGIGLVLLRLLSTKPEWNYSIMLSN